MPRHNYIIHMLYIQYLQEYEHEHDYYHYYLHGVWSASASTLQNMIRHNKCALFNFAAAFAVVI